MVGCHRDRRGRRRYQDRDRLGHNGLQATLQSAEYPKPCAAMLLKTSYAVAASAMLGSDSSVTDSVLSLFEAGANGGETGRTDSGGETKSIRDFTLSKDKALMIYWPRCVKNKRLVP